MDRVGEVPFLIQSIGSLVEHIGRGRSEVVMLTTLDYHPHVSVSKPTADCTSVSRVSSALRPSVACIAPCRPRPVACKCHRPSRRRSDGARCRLFHRNWWSLSIDLVVGGPSSGAVLTLRGCCCRRPLRCFACAWLAGCLRTPVPPAAKVRRFFSLLRSHFRFHRPYRRAGDLAIRIVFLGVIDGAVEIDIRMHFGLHLACGTDRIARAAARYCLRVVLFILCCGNPSCVFVGPHFRVIRVVQHLWLAASPRLSTTVTRCAFRPGTAASDEVADGRDLILGQACWRRAA